MDSATLGGSSWRSYLTRKVAVNEEECVRWLVAHRRLRVAVTNNKGESPLHIAAREGNIKVFTNHDRLIIDH